ncbi:hypothetical protein [Brachybacterium sp. UNK5269]|uniref:ApeA N-terminal domain 1-containing protein n=1 Tax=Brachybacterium sp. UNK5269 TaxID=3408576 RepID=UPI003BB19B47
MAGLGNNVLVVGEPRLGWLVDGVAETPPISVLLRDTGNDVELTVPLGPLGARKGAYEGWFDSAAAPTGGPVQQDIYPRIPRQLLVEDVHGAVVLVGCSFGSVRQSFHAGQGKIIANFAVLGARRLDYGQIDGMRMEVPALARWMRFRGSEWVVQRHRDGRVKSASIELPESETTVLSEALELSAVTTWRTARPEAGKFFVREQVLVETRRASAVSWDEHLAAHDALLDLISLSAWRPFGIARLQVRREDDVVAPDGRARWLDVVTHWLPEHEAWASDPKFLFHFAQIDVDGVARWCQLRTDYADAVGPMMSVLRSAHQWSHASVVQSGVALENLGYLIEVKKNEGRRLNARGQISFRGALGAIIEDMEDVPLEDVDRWKMRAIECYMGAKHPDRATPDAAVMGETLRENLLVVRYWVALQVGASPESLRSALATDLLRP